MSIEVSCECGKRFTVGDQFAGKRGRCKACGRTVTVPSPESPGFEHELFVDPIPEAKVVVQTVAPIDRGPPVPLYPSFSKPKRGVADQSARVSIHFNPVIVIVVLLAIGIPAGIYLIEQGPVKARDDLEKIEPIAEGNITTQITRAIQHEYARFVFSDNGVGLSSYKALNVVFDDPVIMAHLPDTLLIRGRTTEGFYKGKFHPRTMRFEAAVPIMGRVHNLEGSVSDEDQSLNLDGKKIN